MTKKFEHVDVSTLDKQLEDLDKERLKAVEDTRKKARVIRKKRDRLLMIDQLTIRYLNGAPLSTPEAKFIEANPEVWKKIKADNVGNRGTRKDGQVVKAGN